jgi:hypothetical protein
VPAKTRDAEGGMPGLRSSAWNSPSGPAVDHGLRRRDGIYNRTLGGTPCADARLVLSMLAMVVIDMEPDF